MLDQRHPPAFSGKPLLRSLFLVTSLLFANIVVAAEEPPENPHLIQATKVLHQAGLPPLPETASEIRCYAWSGLTAGVYASLTFENEEALAAYLATFPSSLEKNQPIPTRLLAPPNSAAPWFVPGTTPSDYVLSRGRIVRAAPEIFRLYVSPEEFRALIYYSWNNKWTYP